MTEANFAEIDPNSTRAVAYVICAMNEIPSRRAKGFNLVILDENGKEKPWPIVVVRWGKQVFGYLNHCPHNNVNLDWERNQFLDPNGNRLMCGKHGSIFDIDTGVCVEGPCQGQALTPIGVAVVDNEVCVFGVTLAEDAGDEPTDA